MRPPISLTCSDFNQIADLSDINADSFNSILVVISARIASIDSKQIPFSECDQRVEKHRQPASLCGATLASTQFHGMQRRLFSRTTRNQIAQQPPFSQALALGWSRYRGEVRREISSDVSRSRHNGKIDAATWPT
ncbi:hypothetical protein Trydic_g16958 [Trypoxylus dichotomus]